mgnify:CR=1 FL=1
MIIIALLINKVNRLGYKQINVLHIEYYTYPFHISSIIAYDMVTDSFLSRFLEK